MEIPQPPSNPQARGRNHQLIGVEVLSFSLAGLLLVLAVEDPGNALRWLLLSGWIVLAVTGQIYAWRAYYRKYPPEPWPGSRPERSARPRCSG